MVRGIIIKKTVYLADTVRVKTSLLLLLLVFTGAETGRAEDCVRGEKSGNTVQALEQLSDSLDREIELPSPSQRLRIEQITTYFENSTILFQYDYLEDIHDGQGLTGGRIGFISSQDMANLVELYCAHAPHAPLCHYLPILKRLQANHDPSSKELGPDFFKAWKFAAKDRHFRQAQDQMNSELYLIPAFTIAAENNIHSQLGKSILYDTNIQQGLGWAAEFAKKQTKLSATLPKMQMRKQNGSPFT